MSAATKGKRKDPYKTLRVSRRDGPENIKRAYRRRSMETHPDRGGDREEFEQVQQAWMVLSDPVKRESYDRTGDWQDDLPDLERRALAVLSKILEAALTQDQDPLQIDLVSGIVRCLDKERSQIEAQRKVAERALSRIAKMTPRWSAKRGKDNLAVHLLAWHREKLELSLAGMRAALEANAKAKELIQGHAFKWDRTEEKWVMSGAWTATTATT